MYMLTSRTRIIALDLETTGLSPTRHRILELGAVSWQNGCETGEFQALVNPGCPIPPRVTTIHGITDAMVADKPTIAEVLPSFLEFCRGDFLLAHNAGFDLGFLNAECARLGLPLLDIPVIDSCAMARQSLPDCPNYRLETLKCALGIGQGIAHRGLADARDCLQVFLRCNTHETPTLTLPIAPPPLPEQFAPLRAALESGGAVNIEYRDTRGQYTRRVVQPLFIDSGIMQAYCLLRQEKRHFALNRIISIGLSPDEA